MIAASLSLASGSFSLVPTLVACTVCIEDKREAAVSRSPLLPDDGLECFPLSGTSASHDVTCPELLPRGPSYFDVLRRETAQCLDEWRARVLFFSCAARGRADGEARQPF